MEQREQIEQPVSAPSTASEIIVRNLTRDFDLYLFLRILKRSIIWVALIILSSLVAAYLLVRYSSPVYESTMLVQISKQDQSQQILNNTGLMQPETISEELELLSSKYLFELAIQKLPMKITYFTKGKILTEQEYPISAYELKDFELFDSTLIGTFIFVESIYAHYARGRGHLRQGNYC